MSGLIAVLASCRGLLGIDPDTLHDVDVDAGNGNDAGGTDGYREAVRADHPVGYWSFDEQPTAPAALDEIGQLRATANGTVSFGAPGIVNTSVRLDGTSFLDVGDVFSFANANAYSFEAWIYPEAGGDEFQDVINKRSGGGSVPYVGYVGYVHRRPDGSSEVRFAVDSPDGSREVSAPVVVRQWQHVVVTIGPGDGLCLYLDGSARGCQKSPWSSPKTTADLRFGKSETGAGLVGSLDELAIYDYELSVGRIEAHSALGRR